MAGRRSTGSSSAPVQATQRRHVERTHAWQNAFHRLARCCERGISVIEGFFDLADTIITVRSLIRRAWTTHRWDTRPNANHDRSPTCAASYPRTGSHVASGPIAVLQNAVGVARGRLLAAAFEIATRDGVDAVSTRAVCTAAGVQAPSLYHHFGDRSGLIHAVVDAAFTEYFHRKDTATPVDDADPRARVAAGWDAHIAFALAYPGLYPAMYPTSGPLPSQVERSGALLRAGFDELEQAGALRPGITAALATNALRAALRGVAHAVTANPDSSDNDLTSATVRDALIHALLADRAHN